MQCACLSLWFRISKKILSPFLNIYSGVHQYHFHSSVFASCIICIDIEDCPYVSLCDPTRLSHNIREAYYTLAVKKHQQQWQCFPSNKYLYINLLLEGIAQSATIDTRRALFLTSFYIFVFDLFSYYHWKCTRCKKLSLCPRKDNDVIIIDFLSSFFLTFNPLFSTAGALVVITV